MFYRNLSTKLLFLIINNHVTQVKISSVFNDYIIYYLAHLGEAALHILYWYPTSKIKAATKNVFILRGSITTMIYTSYISQILLD